MYNSKIIVITADGKEKPPEEIARLFAETIIEKLTALAEERNPLCQKTKRFGRSIQEEAKKMKRTVQKEQSKPKNTDVPF